MEKGLSLEEGELESAEASRQTWKDIVEVVDFFRSLGGYFRRWEGGASSCGLSLPHPGD
jgi:hypothetical protein